jgi:hypothetical protein
MWLATRRPFATAAVSATGLLLAVACGSDDPAGPPDSMTRPLVFEYFIHPGTVQSGHAASLRAGVFVGPDLCWKVAGATITQKQDSLVLTGLGVFQPQGAACPTALAYDSVQVALPALAAGRYWLVADDLVDTLVVTPSAGPSAVPEAFAAHGRVLLSLIPEECPRFECRFAGFEAVATTSAGIGYAFGYPVGQRMPRDEMLSVVRRIADRLLRPIPRNWCDQIG